MSEIPEYTNSDRGGASWQMPAIAILALIALGGLFFGWSNSAKLDAAKQTVSDQVKSVQQTTQQDLTAMKERLAIDEKTNADLQGDLKVVTDKLKITQSQLKKARTEAAKLNTETTEKLTALDTSVHSELATKATNDDVKTVDTKVATVSDNLAKTNNDLNMARSELGTLIAKNHDEIDVLRRMGERDYIEFTIAGRNQPQKVGNVTVELKGVNEKRNRANIIVVLEDKKLEEKNRNINSPIIIYPSGAHQAEEVVINKIGKNSISGYLSMPKSGAQPATSASSKSGN
jgi:chromosome segregation ATPase